MNWLKNFLTWIDKKENHDPSNFWMWGYILSFTLPLFFAAALFFGLPLINHLAEINADSAKNALSTILQCQVSIIAIVIAISLVALELSITKYGKEVFEIFTHHPAMWLLLLSYILSIILNTALLLSIIQPGNENITDGFKVFSIYYTTFLFFMLLFVLIPHFRVTMNQLHSDRIFLNLIDRIKVSDLKPRDDPFQAIFSIIYSAIEKNDFQTMSDLISGCKNKYVEIMNSASPSLDKPNISFRFFEDLQRATSMLLTKNEAKFVFEILTRIREICDNSLENNESVSFNDSIKFIGEIGAKSLNLDYKQSTINSIFALTEYYDKSKTNDFFTSHQEIFSKSFYNIGVAAFIKKDFGLGGIIIETIKRIIKDNIESNEYVSINAISLYCQLIDKSVEVGTQQFYNEGVTFLTEKNHHAKNNRKDNISTMIEYELESIKAINLYYSELAAKTH